MSDVQNAALSNLAILVDAFQDADVNIVADAAPLLVALIYPSQLSIVQLTAVSAVLLLARKWQHIADAFIAAGAIPKLTDLLRSQDAEPALQEAAAEAITFLTPSP